MSIYVANKRLLTSDDLTYLGNANILQGGQGPFVPTVANNEGSGNQDVFHIFNETSISLIKGESYLITASTNTFFSSDHGFKNNPNIDKRAVIWFCQNGSGNPQIVSDGNTNKTGTLFVWNMPTGNYNLRVNTYNGNGTTKVENVKVVKLTPVEKMLQQQINELKK